MSTGASRERALAPQDLARLLVARANGGDVEGMVALYEPDAVLACGGGRFAVGSEAIRGFYADLAATGPRFKLGDQRPALVCGQLALTSTRLPNGAVTAAVARQQADGAWLWVVDEPSLTAVPKQRIFPQLRMTGWDRTRAFYVDGLGFQIDWEHRFAPGMPVFASVSRDGLSLYLTEHRDDCQVGGAVYLLVRDVDALYGEWRARGIRAVEPPGDTEWGAREMTIVDPDGNKLRFSTEATR